MPISFTPVDVTTGVVNSEVINDNFNTLEIALQDAEIVNTSDYGSDNVSPDANGEATISHALGNNPGFAIATVTGDHTWACDIVATSSSDITIRIKDTTDNSDVTTGTHLVFWLVRA